LTVAEKCAACGVTEKTLRNWWALGCPKDADVEETLAWRDAKYGKREKVAADDGEDLNDQKKRAEIAKLNEEVRAKSLDNRVREGELVNRDAVARWLSSAVTEIRQQLESLPAVIVSEVPGDSRLVVNDVATEQVRLLLLRLSQLPEEIWADEGVSDA
jgi:phage terminase Nu1 subunit (DNA packaging protein)